MRLEAHGRRSSALELAFVSSSVPRPDDRSERVVYFDMRSHAEGKGPLSVHRKHALSELLTYPLLFEQGIGGYHYSKDDRVQSTTGVNLTLQNYTRSQMFQNLGTLGAWRKNTVWLNTLVWWRRPLHIKKMENYRGY